GDGVIDLYDDFPNNNRKTTFPPNHGKGKITVDITSVLGAYLTEAGSMSVNPQTGGLAGYHFNDGLITFKVNGGSGAGTVALTYPETIPAGSKVYKVTQDGYREVSGAVISGNTVTVPVTSGSASAQSLTYGGTGTATANVVGVASPDAATSASSGGGCSATGTDAGDPAGALGAAALIAAGLLLRRKAQAVRK
ncbi:MAG TPA: choice-of-anchor U domain-containing protein, partial [Candidatus Deferrimicrobiaceae bacterium]